ncbi:MAG: thiamine-phosphate kinase [Pseudomonadota bacterium]
MTSSTPSSLSEHDLIAKYFRPLALDPAAFGLIDDAAFLPAPDGCDLVLSVDAIVEGVHFLAGESPKYIAQRALRVNISDLIAKGADPLGYLLTLFLPNTLPETWLAAFADALEQDQSRYGIALLGGDTVRGPHGVSSPVTVSIAIHGTVPAGQGVRRQGARVGDVIAVTGTIGDAALGLRAAQGHPLSGLTVERSDALARTYRVPEPPFGIADAVRECAKAAMDISDGLVGDLDKLCLASGVSAVIEADLVPLSDAAKAAIAADPALLANCLSGGDDYQVLAAMSEEGFPEFMQRCEVAGVSTTMIGRITDPGVPVSVIDANGEPLALRERGYSHRGTGL